jgi:hypothetical protein
VAAHNPKFSDRSEQAIPFGLTSPGFSVLITALALSAFTAYLAHRFHSPREARRRGHLLTGPFASPLYVVEEKTTMFTVDRDIERLSAVFKQGPLREWPVEDIAKDKIMRFAETYLMMVRIGYRPAAPSDGLGNIQLSHEQFMDEERLYREAAEYALKFNCEEDGRSFRIGCSNYSTNRAYVLSIQAARLLASGSDGDQYAARLLKLAIEEIEISAISNGQEHQLRILGR